MKFVLFYHSLVSDWNHGNAHFLRGVVTELLERGHDVDVYEPARGWSVENLVRDHGTAPLQEFHRLFPKLRSHTYELNALDLDALLDGADVVIVHEWSDPELVRRIGVHRATTRNYRLFFHDTHHRAATKPDEMAQYDLSHYDGVLAYGEVIRQIYLDEGWTDRAWTWHEAADVRLFHPRPSVASTGEADAEVVWIGNWGDDERTAELHEFLIDPLRQLKLRGNVFGVRYPQNAVRALHKAGIHYGGWLPNWRAPEVFSRHRLTVHVPRRPYVTTLRGIPTIRPFEALASGIPLISAPWDDSERLFRPGKDYLVAQTGAEMRALMRDVLNDRQLARSLVAHGLETILDRHTCGHRVTQLLSIVESLGVPSAAARPLAKTALPQELT